MASPNQDHNFRFIPTASFRDPAGSLVTLPGRIIRVVTKSGLPNLDAYLHSTTAKEFIASKRLISSKLLDADDIIQLCRNSEFASFRSVLEKEIFLEHERIPFPSYPYEWPPEMLHSAATLLLDLAEGLLAEGMGLKDATPFNILFRGPQPVYVDLLSIERRIPDDPIWLAYGQFVRTFLLPLLVNEHLQIPLDQIFLTRRDGLEPREVYALAGPIKKWLPPVLTLSSIPVWLGSPAITKDVRNYYRPRSSDPEKARFILRALFKRLRRQLNRLKPDSTRKSSWSDYSGAETIDQDYATAKHTFVNTALADFKPSRVLDIGCNTGHFSLIAAGTGCQVVAIDQDPVVVADLWRRALAADMNVLPLVINLARPSPGSGWRNQECRSFLERTEGTFDIVFFLAVYHHLLINEGVPLPEILDLTADLTTDLVLFEFVDPADSNFAHLARSRHRLFSHPTKEQFESACARRFRVIKSQQLCRTRWLYLFRRIAQT